MQRTLSKYIIECNSLIIFGWYTETKLACGEGSLFWPLYPFNVCDDNGSTYKFC